MTKKEVVICAGSKCPKAKSCYYHEVDPAALPSQRVRVVDSLNENKNYACEHFKLTVKVKS